MAFQEQPSLFLLLPVELRIPIYRSLFHQSASNSESLSLLFVCRQIRDEALPIWLKEPKCFDHMELFVKWALRLPLQLQRCVKEVSIDCRASWWKRFQHWYGEVSPPSANGPISPSLSKAMTAKAWEKRYFQLLGISPASTRHMTFDETEDLKNRPNYDQHASPVKSSWDAFLTVENVQNVSLYLDGNYLEDPVGTYVHHHRFILEMAANAWPQLRELNFSAGLVPLEFLRCLTELRVLRFVGASSSTPEQTLDILQSLTHLHTLTLRRHKSLQDCRIGMPMWQSSRHLSVTPDVLAAMNPLRELELVQLDRSFPVAFITMSMIRALHSHAESLESLVIRSNAVVNEGVVAELSQLLPCLKKLKTLELSFEIPTVFHKEDLKIPTTVQFSTVDIRKLKGSDYTYGNSIILINPN